MEDKLSLIRNPTLTLILGEILVKDQWNPRRNPSRRQMKS